MAGSFKSNKQVFLFNPDFYRQVDFLTALDDANIDARHPQINGTFAVKERTRTTRYDCNDVDIIEERIDSEFARKQFQFAGTAEQIAGWLALSYGAVAAPTGTPQNTQITLSSTGTVTSGTFLATFEFEGLTGQTEPISVTATAAQVATALNLIRSIKNGGTVVGVSGTIADDNLILSFEGRFANAAVPNLTIDNTAVVGGGTVTSTRTQVGTNKVHSGTRAVSDVLPYTSFIEGFIGDSTNPIKWYGFAVDVIIIEAQKGGDLLCTVELIGKSDTIEAVGYSIPACINPTSINTKDCRISVNSSFVAAGLSSFRFERRNNIVTSAEAFAFDSIELETNERGDKPTETLSFSYQGSRGDATYTSADAESSVPVLIYLGKPTERVTISAPTTNLKLGSPPVSFDGALRKSIVNIVGQPYYNSGLSASSAFEANIARTAAFLVTEP